MRDDISNEDYLLLIRNRISQLLSAKDISEYEFSLTLGKNKSYINKIVNGISNPSIKELLNICECLDIAPYDLFEPTIDINDLSSRYDTIKKIKHLNKEDYKLIDLQVQRLLSI